MLRVTTTLAAALLVAGAAADDVVLRHDIRMSGTVVRDDLDGVVVIGEKNVRLHYRPDEVVSVARARPSAFEAAAELVRSKDFASAALAFERFALNRPAVILQEEAWLRVAQCYSVLGDWERAIHAYAAVLRTNPRTKLYAHVPLIPKHFSTSQRALQFLGGFIDGAETNFPRAIGQLLASSVLITEGEPVESERGLRILLGDKDPRVVAFARVRWAQLLVQQNRWSDALGGLRKWIPTMDPGALPQAYYWLGECYWKKADYARAAAAFLRAPIEFPDFWEIHPVCLWQAAQCFKKLGQSDRARKLLHELVSRFPKSPDAHAASGELQRLHPLER